MVVQHQIVVITAHTTCDLSVFRQGFKTFLMEFQQAVYKEERQSAYLDLCYVTALCGRSDTDVDGSLKSPQKSFPTGADPGIGECLIFFTSFSN